MSTIDRIKAIIAEKPQKYVRITFVYLAVVALWKWWMVKDLQLLWFVVGGVLGIFFLDTIETFFTLKPSPFRTQFFNIAFVIVSFFVITSSGSFLASGLVLSTYLELLFYEQWRKAFAPHVRIGLFVVFVLETYFFLS